jgi:membrane protein
LGPLIEEHALANGDPLGKIASLDISAESRGGITRGTERRPDLSRPERAWSRWRRIVTRTFVASTTDQASLAAAGCAFYATLSLFPAISMLISIYGLLFDPGSVVPQLEILRDLLPGPAFGLIEDRVMQLVAKPSGPLTMGLAISFLLSVWSSASATKSILSALNLAYDVTEPRPFLQSQAIGLAVTLSAAICAVLAIAVMLVLPALIKFSGLSDIGAALIQIASFVLIIAFFAGGLAALYAHGPSRPAVPVARVMPGTALATVLWLVSSGLLSIYVGRLANFDATYGSIGAVVGIMLWFYVSAYTVVLGAELNAQLENDALRGTVAATGGV